MFLAVFRLFFLWFLICAIISSCLSVREGLEGKTMYFRCLCILGLILTIVSGLLLIVTRNTSAVISFLGNPIVFLLELLAVFSADLYRKLLLKGEKNEEEN